MRTDRQWETLAGEYVIGTLSATERKVYSNILRHDLDFHERVSRWQNTFAPLDTTLESIEPDPRVWQQIATTLRFTGGALETASQSTRSDLSRQATPNTDTEFNSHADSVSATAELSRNTRFSENFKEHPHDNTLDHTDTGDLSDRFDDSDLSGQFHDESGDYTFRKRSYRHRSRHTRRRPAARFFWFVIGAMVASAIWSQQGVIKAMLGPSLPGALPAAPLGFVPDLVSVINDRQGRPAWVISAEMDYRRLQVVTVNPPARDLEQNFQLWLSKEDQRDWLPVGILTGAPGKLQELYAEGLRRDVTEFVVSLEPEGGSTKGRPTSELLFRGIAHSIK